MKVKVSSLRKMLETQRAKELAEREAAKESAIRERRKELAGAIKQTEELLKRMRDAVASPNGKVLGEFRGPHLYSARDDNRHHGESTVERALRILSLTVESEITLAEATRLVGDALKL